MPDGLNHGHPMLAMPPSRVDGPLKVSGQARYAAEYDAPGLLHGCIVALDHRRADALSRSTLRRRWRCRASNTRLHARAERRRCLVRS